MKLIAYSASKSGGMNGGYSSTSIDYTDDGRCRVCSSNRPFHSQPTRCEKYYAEGLLEKLSEVCKRYNVIDWTDLPDSEVFMRDAPTVSDCFTFENGTKIIIGSGKQYSKQIHEMYQELNELIRDSRNYATDIEVTEEEFQLTMGMMMFGPTDKAATVKSSDTQSMDFTGWAKFCSECGAKFLENVKFCAECGSMRQKL